MAVQAILQTKSFSIEVKKGVNDLGEDVFGKRTFSKVKLNATSEQILEVSNVFKGVLDAESKNLFINDVSVVEQI